MSDQSTPRAIEVAGLIGHLVPMAQRFRSLGMVLPGVEASIPMLHALHTILLERETASDPRTPAPPENAQAPNEPPQDELQTPWPTEPTQNRPTEPPAGFDANAVLSRLLAAMRARGYYEPSVAFHNYGMDLRVAYGPSMSRQTRVVKLERPYDTSKVMRSYAPQADDDQDEQIHD